MTSMTSQMWATLKSKFRNALNRQRQFEVVLVKPVNPNTNTGDKNYIEAKHLKMFRAIWSLIDSMAFLVGVSAIRDENINARMALAALLISVTYPILFYTKFVVWPSVPLLLEVICIYGVLIPGTLKFILILRDMKQVVPMYRFFENILISHTTGRRSDDLVREMNDAYNKVKIFVVVSVLCFAVFVLYPIHAYITEGQLIPIMRIEFPFVDQTVIKGYLIGQAFMLLFGVLGLVGSVAFDLAVLTFLLEFKSLVTLLVHDLDDYEEFSKENETYSTQYKDSFLKNICRKYNDIHRYLRCFQRMFADITYHSICALYGSLICSVYAALNNGWISGYGFCLFCFVQLYVQCILGTFVHIQNDRMSQAFYLIPWYEYPIRVQKIFLLLIHASTFNAVKLRIGPYAPLDVQTGLMITKSIFSYYTAISSLT
ncbi:putative odorant receptor 83c isoform X2 [Bradysia coprophila]|uniref:putative odorant receptor 83c isoform X2 n=1 Tax=Bradysia coprophila TaxID=38358 RepID=UPI00187DC106|nr:putative odorant receptor 83c isoform X2 [Bradysia coprophila]